MTKNKTAKNRLKRAASIIMLLVLLTPLMQGAAARAEGGQLRFDENGDFKILLLADTQDVAKPQKEMLAMLNASLDAAQPDFVVYLGDIIHGNDIKDEESARAAITAIVQPVAERGLPFAVVFGNHDDNGGVSKETQMAIYQSFPGCLSIDGEDLTGCGNYNLPILGSSGEKIAFNLWFFDSGSYDPERKGSYDYVRQDQIDWYIRQSEALKAENGGEIVPSFAFQHIIVPEIYDILTVVPKGTEGAVKGHGSYSGSYYTINEEHFSQGTMGEGPCPPDFNSGEFAAWKQQGDITAAFFGHDHKNDFVGSYEGIDLVMTPGIGFYIYGNGDRHGTRVVTLHESDLSYDTELLYYIDLVGQPPFGIASSLGARYELPLVLAICFVLAIIVVVILLIRRHKKRRTTV